VTAGTDGKGSNRSPDYVLRDVCHATLKCGQLDFVKPDDEISVAITRMVAKEYSQMPVLAAKKTLTGVVTWQSITDALLSHRSHNPDDGLPRCQDACDTPDALHRFQVDTPLLEVLKALFDHDFILTFEDGQLFGIMTPADVVRWADERAMSLVEIRGLELRLRDLCQRVGRKKGLQSSDMSFKDYSDCLLGDGGHAWNTMSDMGGWQGLNRREFKKAFKKAMRARNKILHFNKEDEPDHYRDARLDIANLVRLVDFANDRTRNAE